MNRDTICVQGGYTPGNGEPRQIPIIQSTTFKYATSEDMGKLFDLEADGYFYSRLQNPTCDLVAKKICELEDGTAAMLTSSGQAANFFALFNICEAGDHIVASSTIYGGTFNLISVTMKKMGIEATFVDPLCTEEELNAAFRPNTKAVFGETIANPALTVLDIEKFAKAAHAHGVPLIVDNTFPTPVNCRPFAWGADIVTHSTTKYMDGHGAVLGGAIVDSGKFDWMAHAEKFPGLCTPDDSYHGITYAERFGKEGAFITKATAQLMRDFGSMQSPMNAYMLNLGLESLHVRIPRHCENGLAVAKYLKNHDLISYVIYPGLEGDKYYETAKKYLPNGSCGVVSFGVKGGRKAAEAFMGHLKTAAIETHVADARTCCLHPASATHRYMRDYPAVFARFLERKAEIVEKYGLDAARPQWRANTVWAGLLIAVGNEYVKSNPKPVREKRKAVEALCAQPEFAKAIRELRPKGLGRNKQIVADLIGSGRFGTLTALYRLKNHM